MLLVDDAIGLRQPTADIGATRVLAARARQIVNCVRARARQFVRKPPPNLFQKGCAPGPGRPKGSRTRLQEFTLQLIDKDFREHGKEVLKRVREKWPQIYLTAIMGLLPRQSQTIESPLADLSDEEIETIEQMLAASRAKLVKKIEPLNGTTLELKLEPSDAQSFPPASPDSDSIK